MRHICLIVVKSIVLAMFAFGAAQTTAGAEEPKKAAAVQPDPTRGPVWKAWHARLDEGKADDYIRYVTKVYHLQLEAWKKAGLITDYKVLINEAHSASDSDITFLYQYANMAALDAPDSAYEEATAKALENLKNDEDAQRLINEYTRWRVFVGRSPIAREVIGGK